MKNALIDPTTSVSYCTGWVDPVPPSTRYTAVFAELPNSARVAEVIDTPFEVASPLFWVECADDVVADQWYYDTATQQIIQVPASPPYPGASGATTGVQSV